MPPSAAPCISPWPPGLRTVFPPWWAPLLLLAVVSTALAYGAGITAAGVLGSRLASFVGLLEVVFASLFAWLLLGEALSPLQLMGGVLILGGIAAVRADGTPRPGGRPSGRLGSSRLFSTDGSPAAESALPTGVAPVAPVRRL